MSNKNVLVVDDDDAIIKLFELVGKKLGLNVVTAENGLKGFKAFSYNDFFMAITDLNMPKMNGVELIEKVRKIPKYRGFPFVIVSGALSDFNSKVSLLERVDVREKPLKKEVIEEIFKSHLQIHHAQAKIINEQDLIDKLIEGAKRPCELMLTIISKDQPKLEASKVMDKSQFMQGDYFFPYTCTIGGNKISIIFSFERELANSIRASLHPEPIAPDLEIKTTFETLRRALRPTLLKILDAVGFSDDQRTMRLCFSYGNLQKPLFYTFDIGLLNKNLKLTNKYGIMQMFIVYEH